MAKKQVYTQQQIIDAITQADGFISQAAARLGCTTPTIYNYAKRYKAVQAALNEVKHKRDDFVESKLFKAIKDENITAIIFYAKTQMKHRGYVERQEVTGKEGEEIILKVVKGVSVDDL